MSPALQEATLGLLGAVTRLHGGGCHFCEEPYGEEGRCTAPSCVAGRAWAAVEARAPTTTTKGGEVTLTPLGAGPSPSPLEAGPLEGPAPTSQTPGPYPGPLVALFQDPAPGPSPRLALETVNTTLQGLGNGPVWAWANNVRAPDSTTEAFQEAARALEGLRGHLIEDVRAQALGAVEAPAPKGRGRTHACEPEDEPELLTGFLWERDAWDEGDEPTVGDLLRGLIGASIPEAVELRNRWVAAGRPSVYDGGGDYVAQAVELARAAGYDVYDSDTRTWVYEEPATCDVCADGECEDYGGPAREHDFQAGDKRCRTCGASVDDDASLCPGVRA